MTNSNDHSPGISAFLAVLRTGSTLAAAKELDISQATVARRIRDLERSLGVMLF
ncbi:MAG: LysR family transcriptional regulator [Boseongicola sp.]|nr:MAG: LysR family transcriptional regulator [Boseongicola sp.]